MVTATLRASPTTAFRHVVYKFLFAAVTCHHKLVGLKQHRHVVVLEV